MLQRRLQKGKSTIFQLGEEDSGIRTRVQVQDFYQLRDECKAAGRLFEDPVFPAQDSSVFFSKLPEQPLKWQRPHDITENPQLFVAGATRFDIKQGLLGDCWLLAALANLTLHEDLLKFIVPHDQGFGTSYAGIFHFRFWQYGRWVEVVIDDQLPTVKGKLVFLRSTEHNEFWSALLEKAYAKLHGSYEALEGGTTSEAMVDFTGGVSEVFNLTETQTDLYKILLKAYERSSLLSCSIMPNDDEYEAVTADGLVKDHAYSITKVKYFHVKTPNKEGKILLIRLRNPWGNDVEWSGPWSDKSGEWILVSDRDKATEHLNTDYDGEFWMSFRDFKERFSSIEICSLSPDAMIEGISLMGSQHIWKMSMFEGEWVRNVTAGGYDLATFWQNPQYHVTLEDSDKDDEDNLCTLIVALMQKNRRKQRRMGKEVLTIGFEVFHLQNPKSLPKPLDYKFFEHNTSVGKSEIYTDLREVTNRFRLKPGTYCIVPTTLEAGEEGEFLIRVFTETKHNMMEYDVEVGLNERNHTQEQLWQPLELEAVKEFFHQTAGEDMEVSWEELKEILDFIAEYEQNKDDFSKEVCRSMVAMMDVDSSGKLNFEEFQILWAAIQYWKKVFQSYEKNGSGCMDAANLRQALSSAGYHLNYRILNILVHRYGNKRGVITFNDFIMCAIRLKAMIGAFRKQAVGNADVATFSIDVWVEKTLYS